MYTYNPFNEVYENYSMKAPWFGWKYPLVGDAKRWQEVIEANYVILCHIMVRVVPTPSLDSNPPAIE